MVNIYVDFLHVYMDMYVYILNTLKDISNSSFVQFQVRTLFPL